MIRSVLVAVDGSEPGGRALDLAGGIAARCGAALTLLHVQAHPAHGGVPKELEDYARIEHVELTEAADDAARRERSCCGGPRPVPARPAQRRSRRRSRSAIRRA